jgi:hypothetical protein
MSAQKRGQPPTETGNKTMACWIRTFHNPHSKKSFEVTSDETNLPQLRARIVRELKKDPEWEDESIYVHQHGLDRQYDGQHPEIDLREV